MNIYRIKRKVLTPYVWYMRHKERDQQGFIKSALEVQYYRPTFYRWLAAMMLNKELLYEAPLDGSSVVLDVGAHVGEWAESIVERYDPRMYLFEPNPPFYKKIVDRFANNPKVRCFRYGLHDHDAVLRLQQQDQGSTIFDENKREGHSVQVELRDVVRVLDELGLDDVGLLKLNIEGGEYDVLDRLIAAGRMPTIRCILVQYHEWRDGAYFRRFKLQRQFRRTHRVEWDYPFIWEKWVRR